MEKKAPKSTKTFMGIPLDRFGDADSYVGQRLINGERLNCTYPQNGIPKTKDNWTESPPTSADVFRFGKK